MSPRNAIACCALGVLLGVGGMRLLGRSGDAPAPAPAPTRPAPADRAAPIRIEAASGARAGELRALVAEEVRAALREHAAPGGKPGDAPAAREAEEPTAAFEPARSQVAARVAHGAWTAADRDWMRGALGTVNAAERSELMRQVIVAANSGALRVDLEGPLF